MTTAATNPDLTTPATMLRGPIARGLKGEESIVRDGGDKKSGVIYGAAVITRGEALGHGMWIDATMLQQVHDAIKASGKTGIKGRFTHPGLSSDGLGTYLGRWKNPQMDGDVVRADIHFGESAHTTPDGDLANYVMDLADDDPEAFGTSIVFKPDRLAEDEFHQQNQREVDIVESDGRTRKRRIFRSPDAKNAEHLPHARLKLLRAVDTVDSPAANPSGLFHSQDLAHEADQIIGYALGLASEKPEISRFDVDPDRVSRFVTTFLDRNGLAITKKGATMPPVEQKAEETQHAENDKPVEKSYTAADIKRFNEAFGAKGTPWLLEGKSFEECEKLHAADALAASKAENEALKADLKKANEERDQAKQQLAAADIGGEKKPVEFNDAGGEKTQAGKKFTGLPDGLAKFAGAIKLPSRN